MALCRLGSRTTFLPNGIYIVLLNGKNLEKIEGDTNIYVSVHVNENGYVGLKSNIIIIYIFFRLGTINQKIIEIIDWSVLLVSYFQ